MVLGSKLVSQFTIYLHLHFTSMNKDVKKSLLSQTEKISTSLYRERTNSCLFDWLVCVYMCVCFVFKKGKKIVEDTEDT